jgi:hypothetical protein
MTKMEIAAIELQMKEQRVSYWEKHRSLPGCKEMAEYFDNLPTII